MSGEDSPLLRFGSRSFLSRHRKWKLKELTVHWIAPRIFVCSLRCESITLEGIDDESVGSKNAILDSHCLDCASVLNIRGMYFLGSAVEMLSSVCDFPADRSTSIGGSVYDARVARYSDHPFDNRSMYLRGAEVCELCVCASCDCRRPIERHGKRCHW